MKLLKDIMTRDVQTVTPDAKLDEVARKMKQFDTGVIPVCDGRRIQGMITDRDIVIRAIAGERDFSGFRAHDVMTRDIEWCYDTDSVKDASRLMRSKQIRRLVVVDRNKDLVGIVSLGDLATETGEKDLSAKTLEDVSERHGRFFSRRRSMVDFGGPEGGPALSGLGTGSMLLGVAALGVGAYFLARRPEMIEGVRDRIRDLDLLRRGKESVA